VLSHQGDGGAAGAPGARRARLEALQDLEAALEFEREPACDYSEGEEGQVCLCCDLFGTAGLQGLVEFSDFPAERAAIERVSLPTGEKLEAAKPGSTFAGRVAFRNLEAWELGLLLYGMGLRESRLGRPVLLGKVKYRRYPNLVFGVVRYEVAALELAPFSQPLDAGGARVEPGARVEGEPLDGLVRALVEACPRRARWGAPGCGRGERA